MTVNQDRNFDPITEHFVKKVYGGLKGEIRLAVLRRDLKETMTELSQHLKRPLRVLDVGAGLAQLSIELATQGHIVTINDISENMLNEAKKQANKLNVLHDIQWLACPYQDLGTILNTSIKSELESGLKSETGFDLILCHALLEWLAEPVKIMPFFNKWLTPTGVLSLCFYNPISFVYRNLVMGNFNLLNNPEYKSDNKKSLTPNHPVSYEEVDGWLTEQGFQINKVSGLRVFHDYALHKRGGHSNPEAILEMELHYSDQHPYKWMARYLHIVAQKQ